MNPSVDSPGGPEVPIVAAFGGLLVVGLALALFILTWVPYQAYRRGHGFLSWVVLLVVSLNPLYPMLLVALLPNKAKMRKRKKYTAELDAKLAAGGLVQPVVETLSAQIERSLGDLPTVAPAAWSIGDMPTHDGPTS